MFRNKNIIITSHRAWDAGESADGQALALELSRHNKVLYVNPPMEISALLNPRNMTKRSAKMLTKIGNSAWVLETPIVLPILNMAKEDSFYDAINKRIGRRFCSLIGAVAKDLSFENIIHINDGDIQRSFYFKDFVAPEISAYYTGNYSYTYKTDKNIQRQRLRLAKKSDIVFTPDESTAEHLRRVNQNTYNIGQGVDLSGFHISINYQEPNSMADITPPIVGYCGRLDALHVNPNLLYMIASHRSDYSFVFVGHRDEIFRHHSLNMLPNVMFIEDELHDSEYMAHFDVCVYPQVVNDITVREYPIYTDRCLALGKPVVAVASPPSLIFYKQAHLAHNSDEFLAMLDVAVAEIGDNSQRNRRAEFARGHSWRSCAERIYSVLEMKLDESELFDEYAFIDSFESILYS